MAYTRNGTNWQPNMSNPSPFCILKPINQEDTVGMTSYQYPHPMDAVRDSNNKFYGNFRTFTGTQKIVNNVITYEDTAELTVFANFPISKEDRVYNLVNGSIYEIISRPEDINQKGVYQVIKLRCIRG